MKCPNCDAKTTKVLDSRPIDQGKSIRRRRECDDCQYRFTTFERVEEIPLIVVKKEGTREEFNREKLKRGLIKACEKRPVSLEQIEQVAFEVEKDLRDQGNSEILSQDIGEHIMDRLAEVDEVAYVRFASVYRQFKDINVFMKELHDMINRTKNS
ncbi:transcriptional regulator NrdR [Alkalibacillus haloalkaliphilus]|uniref:Transcriptional repressor NrdR n=1 Tax=Alkalibacillus haloalkaliphilus TaxID=94136 RepID=A0A511W957_9BACI|nr:transcriptional regulator NrdR [Alkalibacillus haloalkaliphilus]MDV2581186.1 transcriptional regulator NrdR [Alkalibacillus haloalkaliphilus]GEN45872.1 transcriptional repressor NrdR [Alkalibacillus haloalkaliphilus]